MKLTASHTVAEEGYLFTWVSHESTLNIPIYFDDYIVTHTSASNVLHSDDYYPFGLPIASSSHSELEAKENRFLYQGKEWQTALALNLYDFHARQYDPSIGRFLGVDPQGQFSSPYAGMGNNPVMGVDPDGEFFLKTLITGVVDLLNTAFFQGGLDFTCKSCRREAWSDYDPTKEGTATNNAWRIDKGKFVTDPELGFFGRAWQLISRFTWEAPTTFLGDWYAHSVNWTANVERVDYFAGATVLWNENKRGGTAIGNYINIHSYQRGNTIRRPGFLGLPDDLLYHEYGHYMQSRHFGGILPLYGGVNSMISTLIGRARSNGFHQESWWERDASQRGLNYMVDTGRIDRIADAGFISTYNIRHPGGKAKWWEVLTLPSTFFWRF